MQRYTLDNENSVNDFISCIDDGSLTITKQIDNIIYSNMNRDITVFDINTNIKLPATIDDVISGKNKETNIVNISVKGDKVHIFKENNKKVTEEIRDFKQFILSPNKNNNTFDKLNGPGHYKYRKYYNTEEFKKVRPKLYDGDYYFLTNPVESYMIDSGITYYKNLKANEGSMVSFDLETTGLDPYKEDAAVLCIGNTYRNGDTTERKLFRIDEYSSQKSMITSWADWIRSINPSILTGYNIYLFDIPYLIGIAEVNKFEILLGRDNSALKFENRRNPRKIRKDGSQEYDYKRPEIWGRDIIDMWIVALKADQATKKYDSYALKHIIKVEGLEKEGRTFYDAS